MLLGKVKWFHFLELNLKKKKKPDLIYVYLYGKNGKTANMILTCEIFLLC